MASNVVKLRRPDEGPDPVKLLDTVSVRSKADILDAAIALDRIARNCGFRVTMWHDISSQQPMVDTDGFTLMSTVFGLDTKLAPLWLNHDRALRSQLIRACRVESEPFWVNKQGFRTSSPNKFLDAIEVKDLEERSLVKTAIVVPVHLPFGQIAAVVFTSEDELQSDLSRQFIQFGALLADIARRFVSGYVKLVRDNPYLPTASVLTNKEVRCLRWAAFGKTDSEISTILDCSHATVRYHIKRTCDKLGASNRAQSVFRAGQLGYLGSIE